MKELKNKNTFQPFPARYYSDRVQLLDTPHQVWSKQHPIYLPLKKEEEETETNCRRRRLEIQTSRPACHLLTFTLYVDQARTDHQVTYHLCS